MKRLTFFTTPVVTGPKFAKYGTMLASILSCPFGDQTSGLRLTEMFNNPIRMRSRAYIAPAFREPTPRPCRVNIDQPRGLFKLCKIGLIIK